jgi:hypothetical protein
MRHFAAAQQTVGFGGKADIGEWAGKVAFDPSATLLLQYCCTAQLNNR